MTEEACQRGSCGTLFLPEGDSIVEKAEAFDREDGPGYGPKLTHVEANRNDRRASPPQWNGEPAK
jgi:hypothetical protein